jgi:hypothetical protein
VWDKQRENQKVKVPIKDKTTGRQTQDTQAGTCVPTTTPPEFAVWNSKPNDGDSKQARFRWHARENDVTQKAMGMERGSTQDTRQKITIPGGYL